MSRPRHAFFPRFDSFELRVLPGQLLPLLENGALPLDQLTLETMEGQQLPSLLSELPPGQSSWTAGSSPAEPLTTSTSPEPTAPTTAVGMFALGSLAKDLGEESDLLTDLLQPRSLEAAHGRADRGHDSHSTCTPAGCDGNSSACGPPATGSPTTAAALPVQSGNCATTNSAHETALAAMANVSLPPVVSSLSGAGASSDTVQQGGTIHTPHDDIPDFGAQPTIVSIRNGNWSNPLTWSAGRVPTTGDVVAINRSTTVTYDVVSNASLRTLVVTSGGRLQFRTTGNTRLIVGNFLVREGGRLDVGTAANPVRPTVRAEIIIADQALDTTFDPRQYGTGLLVWGQVNMHGAVKNPTFVRLAVEPHRGDTTLTFEQPVTGWRAGDQLVLPPTTPVLYTELNTQAELTTEELTVRAVSGNVVTLSRALSNDHTGAYDGAGNLTFLPHVGNLTRNVVIRSQNPQGTRGHTLFTDRADVDLRYVQFKDLGRTNGGPLDNTVLDSEGNPVHIGTNQIGRYALHAHHLWGPLNSLNQGYQYELVGNVIDSGRKWGMAFHGSHYGLIQDNLVYRVQEAGIATEDGSESFNVFAHNFVVRVGGDQYDLADGFWIGGPRNYFRDNVVASVFNSNHAPTINTGTGFHLDALAGPIRAGYGFFPLRRGADMTDPAQTEELELTRLPFLEFRGNEGYAMDLVFWNDHHVGPSSAVGGHLVQDLRAWGVYNGAANAYGGAVTFDGVTVRKFVRVGFLQQSTDGRIVLRNFDIQESDPNAMGIYYTAGAGPEIELLVENGLLRTAQNVVVSLAVATGSYVEPSHAKRTFLNDVRFAAPTGLPLRTITLTPVMDGAVSLVPVLSNTVQVTNYNGQLGNNFQVYFYEQHPDFIVPAEDELPYFPDVVRYSVPERGLTNTEAWARYGLAMAGAVAPCTDDTTRPEIAGYTCGS